MTTRREALESMAALLGLTLLPHLPEVDPAEEATLALAPTQEPAYSPKTYLCSGSVDVCTFRLGASAGPIPWRRSLTRLFSTEKVTINLNVRSAHRSAASTHLPHAGDIYLEPEPTIEMHTTCANARLLVRKIDCDKEARGPAGPKTVGLALVNPITPHSTYYLPRPQTSRMEENEDGCLLVIRAAYCDHESLPHSHRIMFMG